ncbi:unnamed protein product [Nippostrongylus brasiliensis]|uniref:NR LBD domain-containing protein n=1 Tax=Nippostrongylus brasiliensis TaxID=27835 RepID=A0A0N4YKC7_NIPBR|nr:unnamed protein product [Nippostrongylus brasiliensis]
METDPRLVTETNEKIVEVSVAIRFIANQVSKQFNYMEILLILSQPRAKLGEKVLRVIRTFRLCLQHNAESIDGTIDG